VGKSGVLEHKSGNISETLKDRGKVCLLWRAYRNSPTLFRTVPFPTPYTPLLFLDWRFATPAQNSNRIRTKVKSPLKIFEKRERGRIQGLPKIFRATMYGAHRSCGHFCDSSAFLMYTWLRLLHNALVFQQESPANAKGSARQPWYIVRVTKSAPI